MLWRWVPILACLTLVTMARAEEYLRQAQVNAAAANAIESLHDQVLHTPIDRDLTVQEFLNRAGGTDAFNAVFSQARQIGGPRWVDDQICQVQMDLASSKVAQAILEIAAANPQKSPLPFEQMRTKLRDWQARTFSATGTSITASKVTRMLPPTGKSAWSGVSAEARQQAIAEAQQNAVTHVIESLRPVELNAETTVGDVLREPQIAGEFGNWLIRRPVTRLGFRDDLVVELTLSAAPADVFQTFQEILASKNIPKPPDQAAWMRVRDEFLQRMATPIGRGAVSTAIVTSRPAFQLPSIPPQWVFQQMHAEGIASPIESSLKTARAAETNAAQKLLSQIYQLPLSSDQTLEAIARQNPQIEKSLQRALTHARTYKAEYRADGSVLVRVVLDLRDVWDEIQINARQ